MKALLLIFAFGMFVPVAAQETSTSDILNQIACRESKQAIGYDSFIESIKKGERGSGVHYSWMDDMRRLGIKQAFFVVHFKYRKGTYEYRVKEAHYLRKYYCYEGEVTDGTLRREIRKSGLERALNDAVIASIKRLEKPYQSGSVKEGLEYRYLLDDANLPIIDFIT